LQRDTGKNGRYRKGIIEIRCPLKIIQDSCGERGESDNVIYYVGISYDLACRVKFQISIE
jgi:hypothetical protein